MVSGKEMAFTWNKKIAGTSTPRNTFSRVQKKPYHEVQNEHNSLIRRFR